MPLGQLLKPPAVGGGSASAATAAAAKKEAPPSGPRAPQQQDVCTLLLRVMLRVLHGQELTLDTVKAAWRELGFSHIFEVRLVGAGGCGAGSGRWAVVGSRRQSEWCFGRVTAGCQRM